LRWEWIEWYGVGGRVNRDREHHHSDNAYWQYSDHAGERSDQLAGRAAAYDNPDNPDDSDHATGYTSG
jgi:hypothetical protein